MTREGLAIVLEDAKLRVCESVTRAESIELSRLREHWKLVRNQLEGHESCSPKITKETREDNEREVMEEGEGRKARLWKWGDFRRWS